MNGWIQAWSWIPAWVLVAAVGTGWVAVTVRHYLRRRARIREYMERIQQVDRDMR